MTRNARVAIITLAVFLFILILGWWAYSWYKFKQGLVSTGTASPKFPYREYTVDELNQMYPHVANENVKTTQAPEETHRIFMEKLKAGDIDGAVECCFAQEEKINAREGFVRVKNAGELENMIKSLDVELRNELNTNLNDSVMATYFYSGIVEGLKMGSSIEFTKNSKGVWLIKSL